MANLAGIRCASKRIGNINALRRRAPPAWPPSPDINLPGSDAGRHTDAGGEPVKAGREEQHQRDLSDKQTKEEQGRDRESGAHPAVHRPEEGGGALGGRDTPPPECGSGSSLEVSMGSSSVLASLEEGRTDVDGNGNILARTRETRFINASHHRASPRIPARTRGGRGRRAAPGTTGQLRPHPRHRGRSPR